MQKENHRQRRLRPLVFPVIISSESESKSCLFDFPPHDNSMAFNWLRWQISDYLFILFSANKRARKRRKYIVIVLPEYYTDATIVWTWLNIMFVHFECSVYSFRVCCVAVCYEYIAERTGCPCGRMTFCAWPICATCFQLSFWICRKILVYL
jgi:hypothetical protein